MARWALSRVLAWWRWWPVAVWLPRRATRTVRAVTTLRGPAGHRLEAGDLFTVAGVCMVGRGGHSTGVPKLFTVTAVRGDVLSIYPPVITEGPARNVETWPRDPVVQPGGRTPGITSQSVRVEAGGSPWGGVHST